MGGNLLTNNPFAILTFIVAPAILTNATSVLAMSTINRMLRTRDRMHELLKESADPATAQEPKFVEKAERVEQQAMLLLSSLRWIYVALGAFAGASLVTLLGALFGELGHETLIRVIIGAGLLLGFVGVGGLIGGCVHLFHATQLSLLNIREEVALIRVRRDQQSKTAPTS
jgi:VIT1/CCC1 family predicted Fe2+/Mn2+ transporter